MSDSENRYKAVFSRHLSFLISPLFLALIAAGGIAFVGGLTMWNGRVEAERDALVYVENHAQIVEEHARQAVREVVQSLAVSVGFLESLDLGDQQGSLDAFVDRIASTSPRVTQLAIFDSHGQIIAGNSEGLIPETFFAPEAVNRNNRFLISASTSFVLIDLPYTGRGDTGGGIVRAGIPRRYFEEFYKTINIRDGSDVGLALPSGEVLVRMGALYRKGDLPSPTVQLDPDGEMHAMLVSVGGIDRFEAYRRLPDIPVLVFSALDARAVFAPWWRELRLFAIIIALIAAPLILLSRLIVRYQRRQRWLASIVESSREAIWSRTPDGNIASWNQGAEQLFGYTAKEIIGQHMSVLWPSDEAAALSAEAERMNRHGIHLFNDDAVRLRSDGTELSVAITGSPIRDAADHIIGAAVTARDVSEKKEVEKRLYRLAYFDPLVELPNRALLEEELAKAVEKSVKNNQLMAFHYLDLDHFKDVNDSFGHQVGDAMLKNVARRITGAVRMDDVVGRLGGDEFGIIQSVITAEIDATHLAERLLQRLSAPFRSDDRDIAAGASIGTVLIDLSEVRTLEPIEAARDLLQRAEIALYEAKTAGRHRHSYYAEHHGDRVKRKMEVRESLTRAIKTDALDLHFQPQVDLATGEIIGAEALVRWNDPKNGPQPPSEFIAIAEQSGLIIELGAWVMRRACQTAASWPDKSFMVSVNVSAVQLRRGGLFDLIRDTLNETGLPPERLELELTESALFHDTEDVTSLLWALRALGVRLAVDDFGTGYSTLSYFKDFPVDKLKIDKSFVDGLTPGSRTLNIVRAATAMAEGLGLDLVAEGIETEAQRDLLRQVGVERGQGFLFSRAVPSEELIQLAGRRSNIVHLGKVSDSKVDPSS
jgi:diguanylate cyclase (GGDEF)-like protein/PAS domain S-box-containing protein